MEKNRDFKKWLSTFRYSISDYKYYINFEKVIKNVNDIKIELNILNSLLGSENIEEDFANLVIKYPEVLKCIPILLAVRDNEIRAIDANGSFIYNFKKMNYPIEDYQYFMRETGLFYIFQNHIVNNLFDYVTGVETGLDSNGRKNRGGHLMEDIIEDFIKSMNVKYYKEMYAKHLEDRYNISLSSVVNDGKSSKRFDFVIETSDQIYVIETNFYKSAGSKLNETARSYKSLAQEFKNIDGITFIWITDGHGWNSAKRNLQETFEITEFVYNLTDVEEKVLEKLILKK